MYQVWNINIIELSVIVNLLLVIVMVRQNLTFQQSYVFWFSVFIIWVVISTFPLSPIYLSHIIKSLTHVVMIYDKKNVIGRIAFLYLSPIIV